MRTYPWFSFRFKMLLIYAACALSAIFMVFAGGGYYVNSLQKRNVEAAITLAQEEAGRLSKDILEMATSQHVSDLHQPSMQEQLKTRTSLTIKLNQNIVYMQVIDPAGNIVVEQRSKDETKYDYFPRSNSPSVSKIPLPGGNKVEVESKSFVAGVQEINQPIGEEGKSMGTIRLHVTQNPTFQKIEASSQTITDALIFGCILLLLFLLIVFLVLWRLFSKQLDLQKNNARLDRMAYVGTLASGLAHEIRNPLSSMSVNLEVMREDLAEAQINAPPRAAELASRVQREVLQLNSTLTSFLEFALPSKEGLSEFSLRGLTEELVELHSEQMRLTGITCEFQAPVHADMTVVADRRMIHQAVRNIMVNAIQAVSQAVKKQVRIRIEILPNDWLRIVLSDSGPGIPAENLGKIFEVFFSTRKGGSGFGLAITRKIIEEHGGLIRAENHSDSLGASFIIDLPRRATPPDEGTVRPARISRFFQSARTE